MSAEQREPGQQIILTAKGGTIADQFGMAAQTLVTRSRNYAVGVPAADAAPTPSVSPDYFAAHGSALAVSGAVYHHPDSRFPDGKRVTTSAIDYVLMADGRKVGELVRPTDASLRTHTVHGKTLD